MCGIHAWLSRQCARAAFSSVVVFTLMLIANAVFAQPAAPERAVSATLPINPPLQPPAGYVPLTVGQCIQADSKFLVPLDTTSTSGITDPHWLVIGPTGGLLPPYHATLSAWTALKNNWVEPTQPGVNDVADGNAQMGTYTYAIWFDLPCPPESYSNLQLTGSVAADNEATVYLNGFAVASCTSGTCFYNSPFSFTAFTPFLPGINSLTVVVHNDGAYTGVAVKAELAGICLGKSCVDKAGRLKICKVAGLGVAPGTPVNFTATSRPPFSVPAGPAPGGACTLGPSYPAGAQVTVTELIPPGEAVSNITVEPAQPATTNLGAGSITLTVGTGVTEVTYTDKNKHFVDKTGFLEICKNDGVAGNFTFTVNPGSLGPFVVPAGACSPAIEVPAGWVTIQEVPAPGTAMLGCATIPVNNQASCDPTVSHSSTVVVFPGNASIKTIAFISNSPITPSGPNHGSGTLDNNNTNQTGRFAPPK
jgi:hypothetical protein